MQNTDAASKIQHDVAGAVRAELARRRISQTAIAQHFGWSQQTISRRMTGAVPFDIAELAAVAEYLGVPIASFLPDSANAA
ncbi:helix-turn-helix transcriptional regulator [Micromonosporaceae bacterium B7E4]